MTGAVTYEQLWGILGFFSAAGGIVAGLLAWLWRIVSTIRRAYHADLEALRSENETNKQNLIDYRQHVAETFASKNGVSQQIERLQQAVSSISDKVESSSLRITERIDRLLENQAHQAAQPRRRSPQ